MTEPLSSAYVAGLQMYADEMGFALCPACHTVYIAAPGYENDGHQCHEDGLQDKYVIKDY